MHELAQRNIAKRTKLREAEKDPERSYSYCANLPIPVCERLLGVTDRAPRKQQRKKKLITPQKGCMHARGRWWTTTVKSQRARRAQKRANKTVAASCGQVTSTLIMIVQARRDKYNNKKFSLESFILRSAEVNYSRKRMTVGAGRWTGKLEWNFVGRARMKQVGFGKIAEL